jgi:hypothetical protein
VAVGVPFTSPAVTVDQVAKAVLPPPVELDFHLPIVLPRRLEGQAFPIPVIKFADQVNALSPDRTGDLERDHYFVFVR